MRLICYSSKVIGQTDWLHKLIAKGREIETKRKPKKVVALKTDCKSERKQNKVVDFPPPALPLSLSPTHPPSNFSRLFIMRASILPHSNGNKSVPFCCCCCCCCVDWSCGNFQHELFLRELFKQRIVLWAWRASILPHSNGNNIVPFVVVVLIEVLAIFNMSFSWENCSNKE